jgi:hypothetical protein
MSDENRSAFLDTAVVESRAPEPEGRSADELYGDILETRRRLKVAIEATRARAKAAIRPVLFAAGAAAALLVAVLVLRLVLRKRR